MCPQGDPQDEEMINLPATILKKGGQKVPISVSTAVLKNERGQIFGGVETFRDLSAIEELRKELSQKYTVGDIISKNHLIHEPVFEYEAKIEGEFDAGSYPNEIKLQLKVGAQVLMIKNDAEKRWVNGSIGEVVELTEGRVRIRIGKRSMK